MSQMQSTFNLNTMFAACHCQGSKLNNQSLFFVT